MPPPAVALVGPLCQSVDLWEAADRIVRAFCFGMLYSVTVYACTRTRTTNYSNTSIVFFRSASSSIWVSGAMVWWLPLAAAQCAVILHARAVLSNQPPRNYKPIESATSTDDDDDLEAASLGDLGPKLADPVAEQDRLLREKPIYADDAPPSGVGIGTKLIDLGIAAHEPCMSVGNGHEPIGQLAFQQLSLVTELTCDSAHNDPFSASVAKAMALEEESSQ